jgi:two-component system OmpR family response regulator
MHEGRLTHAQPDDILVTPQDANILIVDDDPSLRALIRHFLTEEGYPVQEAEDGPSMRHVLDTQRVDIIILDVMMPGEDGLSLARSLAGRHDSGIIMVSALGTETDRITGLEMGADDYLPKPVSPRELLARVRALQRRRRRTPSEIGPAATAHFHFQGWQLDPIRRVLRDPHGIIISLSEGEFALLLAFIENPLQILTRDQLVDLARGQNADVFDRAIDTQVSRLRRKLGTRPQGELIQTVRSEGYIFQSAVTRG